ncbi:hypothetical protein PAXINDRAFT_40429, partial [Paxillus involutus ATCC 200175]
ILTQAHDELGHRGEQSTWKTLQAQFFWPHIYEDAWHHVKSSHECQICSTKKMHIPPTIFAPATIFTKTYIDVMRMNPAAGLKYIVLARDDLSRYVKGRALCSATAKSLCSHVRFLSKFSCLSENICFLMNGPEFKGVFAQLLARHNIPQITISPYNSQANGVVERG